MPVINLPRIFHMKVIPHLQVKSGIVKEELKRHPCCKSERLLNNRAAALYIK
jgi:hypothetical protein